MAPQPGLFLTWCRKLENIPLQVCLSEITKSILSSYPPIFISSLLLHHRCWSLFTSGPTLLCPLSTDTIFTTNACSFSDSLFHISWLRLSHSISSRKHHLNQRLCCSWAISLQWLRTHVAVAKGGSDAPGSGGQMSRMLLSILQCMGRTLPTQRKCVSQPQMQSYCYNII